MNPSDLLTAIAAKVNTIPGLTGGAHYPALNVVERSPTAMIRLSPLQPTMPENARFGQQVWTIYVDVMLLVDSNETRPGDAARLDPLIPKVLDLFDPSSSTYSKDAVPSDVDRVWHTGQIRVGADNYGATGYCHFAIVTLDGKFHRRAV